MSQILADLVDAYVLRERESVEFLQLRRVAQPMAGTWQPVMGHVEAHETAVTTVVRELAEEVGLRPGDDAWLSFWQLEEVHPYFVAALDAVVLSPRFAVLVESAWEPDISNEDAHDAHRWVPASRVEHEFLWPGQWRACAEAERLIATRGSGLERALRLRPEA
ncbi:MAG: NUDIX domain-containing protein [Phycisphaerales bacterium]